METVKLVDILARELKVWPGNHLDVGQADDGSLHVPGIGPHERHTTEKYTKADDWFTAVVTRTQWQAAVDALKAAENEGLRKGLAGMWDLHLIAGRADMDKEGQS